jgi:hypothetical protein
MLNTGTPFANHALSQPPVRHRQVRHRACEPGVVTVLRTPTPTPTQGGWAGQTELTAGPRQRAGALGQKPAQCCSGALPFFILILF